MPSSKGLYKIQVKNRNAFWSYEYLDDGTSATVKFGRIGSTGGTSTKDYGSSSKRDREIQKKIDEKLREGYKVETEEGLQKELEVVEALGTQQKIQNIYYVTEKSPQVLGRSGPNSFQFDYSKNGKDYNPDLGIIVEVLNSWSKETTWLLLTKKDSQELTSVKVPAKSTNSITANTIDCYKTSWVKAIRKYLSDTAKAVAKIVTQQFGMATRKLQLGDEVEDEDTEVKTAAIMTTVQEQKVGGGMGEQVLMSFAGLGDRVLELD